MKVLIDDQIFNRQTRGGISRYFVELIKHMSIQKRDEIDLVHSLRWTCNAHAVEAGLARPPRGPLARNRYVLRALNKRAPQQPVDLVHHTYYHRSYLHSQPGAKRVVTVYDMIPELFPELFPFGNPHASKREFVDAADLVLCISNSAKEDLIRIFGTPRGRVVVTPLGVDDLFRPDVPRLRELPESYVMFVGKRSAYKDFSVLVGAMADLRREFSETWIVAVGGGSFSLRERRRLSAAGLDGRVIQLALNDSDLNRAYAHARAFVFPSRYEGFGLPTLEAMASGSPVILADSSAHPEVGGTEALYFPAGDAQALRQTLRHVLSSRDLAAQLGDAGVARAGRFRWSEVCSRTVMEYRQTCDGTGRRVEDVRRGGQQ